MYKKQWNNVGEFDIKNIVFCHDETNAQRRGEDTLAYDNTVPYQTIALLPPFKLNCIVSYLFHFV